ncbi:hypothetical protein [Streptomyces sp. Isolate_219]|uniref:hypothetical protein n=1 Tax=Streptomyces sp. Isolate_219 TaxID=2950110 RepID=UPI0021C885E1|nr:hypothetical protein [Streptomyces sp. Isolate_219]MCR8573775.1 hypothetical protein [Streptomyces sp. Isolate_219]
MSNAKIGVALVGGYLLGRTKKAKMAIGLGMFLAGKKLNLDPKQLGTLVANSPVLGPLNDQVRKELVDATKAAAGTALTQRMSGLADSLHERTAALTEGRDAADDTERAPDDEAPRAGADDEGEAPEGRARGDAEGAEDAADAEEEDEEPAPRRRKSAASTAKPANSANSAESATTSAAKSSAKSAKKTGTAAARRPAASASRASGKTAAASSRGRPAASSGRKAASGARKKASGAARTAADRGGSNG